MPKPLMTHIMAGYRKDWLPVALKSLQNQDEPNIEIIVADTSEDGLNLRVTDERVTVIRSDWHTSYNTMIKMAKADVVSFWSDDDIAYKDKTSILLPFMEHCDVCVGTLDLAGGETRTGSLAFGAVRKTVFTEHGIWIDETHLIKDAIFILDCLYRKLRFCVCRTPTGMYRTDTGITVTRESEMDSQRFWLETSYIPELELKYGHIEDRSIRYDGAR